MSDRPARPSRLNGLRHLALLMPNLEECERFYVDVLGMEVLNRANEDLVYLTCGNDNLSLGRAHAASNGLQTMDHYGFVVDSVEELEAWYRYLKRWRDPARPTLRPRRRRAQLPPARPGGQQGAAAVPSSGIRATPGLSLGQPSPLSLKGEGRLGTLSASNLACSSSPLLDFHQARSAPAPPSIRQRKRFHRQAQTPPQRGVPFFAGSQ